MVIEPNTYSIIIVTHNCEKHLEKAMASIKNQSLQPKQIIIVDSGSEDPQYLNRYSEATIIHNQSDIGFCMGNNIGYKQISDEIEFIFFLNPDAFPSPNFAREAIEHMNTDSNCGALTGTLLGYNIESDKPTGFIDTTGIFQKWYGKWYDRDQGKEYDSERHRDTQEIPAICAASLFCRKKALDSTLIRNSEVMDNTFYMYKEDIDLSLRLKKKGWKLLFIPHLSTYHCRGWQRDRKKMPREFRLCSSRNELRIQFRKKHPIGILYSLLKHTLVKICDL